MNNYFSDIRDAFVKLKFLQKNVNSIYLPSGEWDTQIKRKSTFFNLLLQKDGGNEAEARLENFWRDSELGTYVKQIASYEDLRTRNERGLKLLETLEYEIDVWKNLTGRQIAELIPPDFGNPWGLTHHGNLIGPKSVRYNMLEWQISLLLNGCSGERVFELGAGYGGFAMNFLRYRQKATYINFDLPETLTLCAWYLTNTLGHDRVKLVYSESELLQNLSFRGAVLAPNWLFEYLPENSCDIFLNTFSLSEVGSAPLENYCKLIPHIVEHYFYHNNMDRPGVINDGFERTPGSEYPIKSPLNLIWKDYDKFQKALSGRDGDYREFLYAKSKLDG